MQADLEAIAEHADAVGQIYAHGLVLSVVERVQAYVWETIIEPPPLEKERVLKAIEAYASDGGVDNITFPEDFGEFDEYEFIVASHDVTPGERNIASVIRGPVAWLLAQTDATQPKLAALDQDEAGSRQWLTFTPSTRVFGFSGQNTGALNVKIHAARLYNK